MKFLIAAFFFLTSFSISSASCAKVNSQAFFQHNRYKNMSPQNGTTMKITVGAAVFKATLYDNSTATAFKKLLPLTITMDDLNGNEKHAEISGKLSLNIVNPGTIQNGDLMIWSSKTLVLFYETFSTPYSYTKLGRVDDVTGLVAALGSGKVTVLFEAE